MVSDAEHVEALRKRLLERRRQQELELAETDEFIRVLGAAPKILSGGKTSASAQHEERQEKSSVPYNLDLAKQVRAYLAGLPFGEVVNRKQMIKTLKEDYGVRGKDSSLYAYISKMLADIAEGKKENTVQLHYKKDVGFFRERDSFDRNDSQLVAQSE